MAGAMRNFAPEDLEAHPPGELKQIRQWLEINLNMLNLRVNGLEMQLATLRGLKSRTGADFAAQAAAAMRSATEPSRGRAAGATSLFPFGMPRHRNRRAAAPSAASHNPRRRRGRAPPARHSRGGGGV